jgi:hypothetical protein
LAFSLVSLVSVLLFNSHYMDGANIINFKDTSDLNTNIVLGEYLRSGTNLDEVKKLTNGLTGENVEVQGVSSKGLNMVLYCKTGDSEGKVSVPRFNYKGYRVMDKNGTTYTIYDGKNNVITFDIPANYDGELIIDYIVPWYWRVAEAISLITWFCLIFQIICIRDDFV